MSKALVLTGGGARAAYQVGVLKGISKILPRSVYNPFPIICGTSAGAINALSIAGRAGPFRLRAQKLERIWHELTPADVYRTDATGVIKNTFHLLASFVHSGYGIGKPISLLDNSPLRQMMENYVKFDYLDTAINNGELQAIAITAMSYASGKSVTFFQGQDQIPAWNRSRRRGEKIDINIDQLMASTAIPGLFPAVKINGDYFGDGAVRQLKPISPALHMGATKLFIIGVSDNPIHSQRPTKLSTRRPRHKLLGICLIAPLSMRWKVISKPCRALIGWPVPCPSHCGRKTILPISIRLMCWLSHPPSP